MRHLTELPAWNALWQHFEQTQNVHMRDLFTEDPSRAERYWLEVGGIMLDYSKNRITDQTLALLMDLAREAGLTVNRRNIAARARDRRAYDTRSSPKTRLDRRRGIQCGAAIWRSSRSRDAG